MKMTNYTGKLASPADEPSILRAERQVLQALCQDTPDRSLLPTARKLLLKYKWREPIHKVIFECLVSHPSGAPFALRDQLPARMTRKGFPEVDWEEFFRPLTLSREEAKNLMRQLHEAGSTTL
jgi:hypothetical protein